MEQYHQIDVEEVIIAMKERQEKSSLDLMEILLDENNRDPIVLTDDEGKRLTFEQIAVIPYQVQETRRLYVILKPMDEIVGIAPNEAIVFRVDDSTQEKTFLKVETNKEIAFRVFREYYKLLDAVRGESNKENEITLFIKQLNKKRKGGKV